MAKPITIEEMNKEFKFCLEILNMTRDWHRRDQRAFAFHPVITEIMQKHMPEDYRLLALEFPHQSVRDASNVAYTRDERSGINDRQTVTTFGRYIRKMFPQLKDHEIRDYATKCRNDLYEIWETSDEIIRSVQLGPKSCMTWDSSHTPGTDDYDEDSLHPYRVYAPELGWKAAVRLDPDTKVINGRGLVWHNAENDEKYFVRTYKRGNDYSYADEALEYWLKENGYKHESAWPEVPLRHYSHGPNFLAPYIDGDIQRVMKHSNRAYKSGGPYYSLTICENGDYECSNTDGNTYDNDDCLCECCDEYCNSDDMRRTYSGDEVCENCADDHYVEAYVRDDYTELVSSDRVIECENEYYHEDYYDRHDIVYTQNDDYQFKKNCVESAGSEWHLKSTIEGNDEYVIIDDFAYYKSDCFFCQGTQKWYTDDEEQIEVDGKVYHKDYYEQNISETEEG
jgi:hypothetical protein